MDILSLLQPLLYSFFLLVPLSILFLHTQKQSKKEKKAKKKVGEAATAPVLKPYPVLGHLPQFLSNCHRYTEWSTELLLRSPTQTVSLHTPLVDGVVTANPVNVEHMLRTRFDNYPKGDLFTSILEDFLGAGIFNVDGEEWRRQRKAASFEFSTRALRDFAARSVREEIVGRLLPLLRAAAAEGAVLDLQDVLQRFAFDGICRVAFGFDPACLAGGDNSSAFMRAFDAAASLSADRFMYPLPQVWRAKRALDVGSERKLRQSIAEVHDFAVEIIRSRRRKEERGSSDDLLSRFSTDSTNSEELLRDIVVSFILAGRETTSSALTWFFWLLSTRPDVEKKILGEVSSVRLRHGSSAETFGLEELREMHYLHAAITESLRLYPPVALDTMTCTEDDVLPDGTFVGKGSFATYNAYAMGRMPAVWGEDCGEYRPERWVGEEGVFRPESPFRFLAFHAGPRACLGKEMAYVQMKSVAACVLERFAVEVVEKAKPPELAFSLTLRMKGGLPIYVRRREL